MSGQLVQVVRDVDTVAEIHRAGCVGQAAIVAWARNTRDGVSSYTMEATTRQAVALDAWSDLISDESFTEAYVLGHTRFMDCCAHLFS